MDFKQECINLALEHKQMLKDKKRQKEDEMFEFLKERLPSLARTQRGVELCGFEFIIAYKWEIDDPDHPYLRYCGPQKRFSVGKPQVYDQRTFGDFLLWFEKNKPQSRWKEFKEIFGI